MATIRRNALFRALRVDKLTLAALEATLKSYLAEREDEVPALRLMRLPVSRVRSRAKRFTRRLAMLGAPYAKVVPAESLLGGGSTPMQSLPSIVVAITPPEGTTVVGLEGKFAVERPSRRGSDRKKPAVARPPHGVRN